MSEALGFPETSPLRIHPVHLLDDDDWALLDLWRHCRGGTVTGQIGGMAAGLVLSDPIGGHLPEAGGALDQVNCTMASLDIIERAFRTVAPRPGEAGQRGT